MCMLYARCVAALLLGDGVWYMGIVFVCNPPTNTTFCVHMYDYNVGDGREQQPLAISKITQNVNEQAKKERVYDFQSKNPFHTTNCVVCKCNRTSSCCPSPILILFLLPIFFVIFPSQWRMTWPGMNACKHTFTANIHCSTVTVLYSQKQNRKMKYLYERQQQKSLFSVEQIVVAWVEFEQCSLRSKARKRGQHEQNFLYHGGSSYGKFLALPLKKL